MQNYLTKLSKTNQNNCIRSGFGISAVPTRTVRAVCLVHLIFFTPPGLAALLRSDGFFSGAVCFVRRTLARSVLLGFQIGIPMCKSVFYKDLVKTYLNLLFK